MVRRRWLVALAAAAAGTATFAIVNPAATAPTLPAPPRDVVGLALREPCLDFARKPPKPGAAPTVPREPVSTVDYGAGASLVLAAAAGKDKRARKATLQQIRHVIDRRDSCRRNTFRGGSNEPTAAGGVSAQRELWATSMFVVARHTPRVWRELSKWERKRIDLIMTASLVSNAFATSDTNPYLRGGQQRTIDGDTNVGRDWNPNYREGMIGNVLMGIAYFGRRGAQRQLEQWNRPAFLAAVTERKMENLRTTFEFAAAQPG
ncbi:MAG: hypothetical protein JHD16_17225, partial [Solirubrobacteraceae bacterium]|nr:hypothetical protein [Solirubrobacteraceae bacterium]